VLLLRTESGARFRGEACCQMMPAGQSNHLRSSRRTTCAAIENNFDCELRQRTEHPEHIAGQVARTLTGTLDAGQCYAEDQRLVGITQKHITWTRPHGDTHPIRRCMDIT